MLFVQVVPGPRQTPLAAMHSDCVLIEQVTPAAAGMQQAPEGAGQRFGEH